MTTDYSPRHTQIFYIYFFPILFLQYYYICNLTLRLGLVRFDGNYLEPRLLLRGLLDICVDNIIKFKLGTLKKKKNRFKYQNHFIRLPNNIF